MIAAAFRLVPESRNEGQVRHFDVAGAITVTAGLIILVYAIVKSIDWGWGSASTLGLIGVAGAAAGRVRRDRAALARAARAPRPVQAALACHGQRRDVAGLLRACSRCSSSASLYLQKVLGYSALETGVAFLPVSVGIVIGSVLAQQLISRLGTKRVLAVGTTLAAIGLATLAATTSVDGTYLAAARGARAAVDRDGPDVRADDAGRDDQRRQGGRRPRLGRVQHLAAGRRSARARGPLDVRQPRPPTTRWRVAPRRPRRWSTASRSRS